MTWHEPARLALEAAGVAHIETGEHYLVAQCDHATLAAALRHAGVMVDALVADPPYSARCHDGHDETAALLQYEAHNGRRETPYASWADADVSRFVSAWAVAAADAWWLVMTDHVLVPSFEVHQGAAYRYTFSPVSCVEVASRARLLGDGPPQWSTLLVPSRPRSASFLAAWHEKRKRCGPMARHGAYVFGREPKPVVGGKTVPMMRAIVGDYSAPGDLVCDPCMGAGTTLVAAVELGRRAIGCEPDAGRFEMACKRLAKARPQLRMRLDVEATRSEQSALALGGDE